MRSVLLHGTSLLFLVAVGAAPAAPVKVFILAGQSNMEGKAAASTLRAAIADKPDDPAFAGLVRDGEWTLRDDVRVTFLMNKVRGDAPLHGKLTVGFGSQKKARDDDNRRITVPGIGPELGIGQVLGDHLDEPVLLIKTAWGGRSVDYHFRSPGAMPGEDELRRRFEELSKRKPELNYEDWKAGFGSCYRDLVAEVRKVTGDLRTYAPEAKDGFELAGLIWFQGWNDGVGKGNPQYTGQLGALIRDLRKDFETPELPVVIGELGIDGPDAAGWIATFREQQAEVAALPEFEGTVRLAKTAAFWPKPPDMSDKWAAFRGLAEANESKAKDDPTRVDPGRFYFENWVSKYRDQLKYTSDKRYHYLGSGECYLRMGRAMGEAMVELLGE